MSTTTYPENVDAPRRALERSAGVQRLLAEFRPRLQEPMQSRELRAEGVLAIAFLIVAVPLAILAPQRGSPSLLLVALFLGVYSVTTKVEFDLGSGFCVPTQIALVPMLFALPAAWVPLLVALSLMAARAQSRFYAASAIRRAP